jgi:nondiscriminating aspartyl-tRNA synthetase
MQLIESTVQEAWKLCGRQVKLRGHIHAIRRMGNLAFVLLRDHTGLIQVTVEDSQLLIVLQELRAEIPIVVFGELVEQMKAPNQVELRATAMEVLSKSGGSLPVEINKDSKMESLSLSTMLDYRPLTLRSPKQRAIFKLEAELCKAFRSFLNAQQFTEIHSPKIVSTGTEGGAQLFKLQYFETSAYLAQSPQFYKQIMVGVYGRVFEIGPVYRAEEHDTTRHLNEYISMDLEMGFIESEQDIIAMQIELLKHMFAHIAEICAEELSLYGATVPSFNTIPQITLAEAQGLLESKFGWSASGTDLDPEGERLLCQYFHESENSELVYITRYPQSVRPFYTLPDGQGNTHSFDLLYKGLEITTGGQRIHQVQQLKQNLSGRGMDPATFGDYLQCFEYGMPPHGGLAIGLERLAKQLLGLPNVKLASLFPRDRNRITP